ncbi:MAG: sulfur carrier protein ThiS [Xanthobacter sp.]
MLSLKVNGEELQLAVRTVADLLQAQQIALERKGIAVALNGAVVPRRNWAQTALAHGDAVEIITARQGG